MTNVIISSIFGLALAYFATWTYEGFQHRRKTKQQLQKFQLLESKTSKFDWQHWNIENGHVAVQPINSHMRLSMIRLKSLIISEKNLQSVNYRWTRHSFTRESKPVKALRFTGGDVAKSLKKNF